MIRFYLLMVWVVLVLPASGQHETMDVPYLYSNPLIDGLPADDIPWKSFGYSDSPAGSDTGSWPHYFTAWNADFFYLLIRFRADSLTIRDRAYQNGDGFHMVVATAGHPGDTAGEFYVLRFSPGDDARNLPPRKGIWYYNKELSAQSLSASTMFATAHAGSDHYFELLLPWSDIHPYHPWADRTVGLNLCLVRALAGNSRGYHYWLYDRLIQWENRPRKYLVAQFMQPDTFRTIQTRVGMDRYTITEGEIPALQIVTAGGEATKGTYRFRVVSADRYVYYTHYEDRDLTEGLNRFTVLLAGAKLRSGGYLLRWKDPAGEEGEVPFTVLPTVSFKGEQKRLDVLAGKASPGTLATLQFRLHAMKLQAESLKSYETAGALREAWDSYHAYVSALEEGHDSLRFQEGIVRRAFISPFDHSLQPYSVKIPEDFNPQRNYPVVVMLHGSGSDDRDIITSDLPGMDDCIVLAPFGRGTSNCFTTDHAPEDVVEALSDVMKNYPVDTSRVIIAGFSMGGYGALRVYWQFPQLFRGVAVLSGHPNLASKWIGEGHPDFLEPAFLVPFRDVPVFIYHSRNDLNCPFPLVEQLAEQLRLTGAVLTITTSNSGGHGLMDEASAPAFREWSGEMFRKQDFR